MPKLYNVVASHIQLGLVMAKSNMSASGSRSAEYVLIAIVNLGRASAVRNLALEFCSTVVLVRDGLDAIHHIDRNGPPILLITELSLPRADGFAVLRHLRRATAGGRAAALAVSSHESLRSAATKLAESLGITQILPLEADRSSLRRAIGEALRSKGATQSAFKRGEPPIVDEAVTADEVINRALLDLT